MLGKISQWRAQVENRSSQIHGGIPGLRKLPLPALAIIAVLVLVNMLCWAAVGAVLVWHRPNLWAVFLVFDELNFQNSTIMRMSAQSIKVMRLRI